MNIKSFIHPSRTFLPCSGVGRHINNLLLEMDKDQNVDLSLLFSSQWISKGKLPENAPLRDLDFDVFSFKERWIERLWKMIDYPKMDSYLKGADWMFSPMETHFPTNKTRTAITIHDIQAFEPDLPWSSDKEHKKFMKRWSLWIHKAVMDANLVFTVSEFSRKRLIALLNLDENKVKVSGNAVDPFFFDFVRKTKSIQVDYPYITVIGGLRPKKGGIEILHLAKKLEKAWPELRLVVWGEQGPHLLDQAKESPNIIVFDMISDLEMIQWVKGAHASLFLSWYEGFGLPVLESMACGTPVICSNKASLPEIAGGAALMAAPDQTDVLLDFIIQLKDTRLSTEMIRKGNKRCHDFAWIDASQNVVSALASY